MTAFLHAIRPETLDSALSVRRAPTGAPQTDCIYCATRLVPLPTTTWRLCPNCEPKLFRPKP